MQVRPTRPVGVKESDPSLDWNRLLDRETRVAYELSKSQSLNPLLPSAIVLWDSDNGATSPASRKGPVNRRPIVLADGLPGKDELNPHRRLGALAPLVSPG